MSGIGEALAIIGAAAALVSACKDGGSIARAIAKRRKKTGEAPPTEMLQNSLEKGQAEITAKINEGSDRFGVAFKNGDNVAVQALKDVTIEMQASLLRHLVVALEDDSEIDYQFLTCEGSVTKARLRAINILNDLYVKQQDNFTAQNEDIPIQPPDVEMPPLLGKTPKRVETSLSMATTISPIPPPSKKSRNLFSRSNRRSTSASMANPSSELSRTPEKDLNPPTSAHMERVQTLPERLAPFDPGAIGSRRSTFSSNFEDQSAFTSKTLPPASRRPTFASTSSSFSDSPGIFCEGAHYVQASTDNTVFKLGFKLCKATATKETDKHFWACQGKNCRVQGVARRDEQGHWQYDDTVRWSRHGIGYRWLFIAKSHIKSTSKDWLQQSKCLICARGLGVESETYKNTETLLAHIARRHCGTVCAGLLMRGPISFDHTTLFTGTQDSYDICFPSECPEHASRGELVDPPPVFSNSILPALPGYSPTAAADPIQIPQAHPPMNTSRPMEDAPSPLTNEEDELFQNVW